jgi:hypothetical protein
VSIFLVGLGLAVNGFFTGLGVVTANTLFDLYIKPKINKAHSWRLGKLG